MGEIYFWYYAKCLANYMANKSETFYTLVIKIAKESDSINVLLLFINCELIVSIMVWFYSKISYLSDNR